MSNLTADLNLEATQWSTQTVSALKQYEQSCADDQLFYIGYLIPLVERLELEDESLQATVEQWHTNYRGYVEQCMAEDNMSASDRQGVLQVFTEVLG
ncbi:hypothetical protein [Reinekea thalattae]|uniref:YfcL family protein n=1 Tax=Reinekea thalattae TaxID=2593301 RepID=A0A5C8Z1L2_9GAMM|nr:hypothetical protein [Reinekea thalattae]TXR51965.1 hypothetical protein FME95_11120 [Reinekea thalattae]